MYAFDDADLFGRASPTDCVFDDLLHVFILIRRIRFVAGLEVEDLAITAGEGASAAEDLTAIEPTDEDDLIGIRNVKGFAVHFFFFEKETVLYAFGDGMIRLDNPDALSGTFCTRSTISSLTRAWPM